MDGCVETTGRETTAYRHTQLRSDEIGAVRLGVRHLVKWYVVCVEGRFEVHIMSSYEGY